jgi:hypothetical protein
MEREYILVLLFLFGTVAMYFKPAYAFLFIFLSMCVGIISYCILDKDKKWDMKQGGIGSRKVD